MPKINLYKFKAVVKQSANNGEYYSLLKGHNNETVFMQETCKNKQDVIDLVNSWFPGVTIIDKTLKNKKAAVQCLIGTI